MKRSTVVRILMLAVLAAGIIAAYTFDLTRYMSFDYLQKQRLFLLTFVKEHEILSVAGYICVFITAVAFPLPGAVVLTLVGGFLFDVLPALFYINFAATTGATVSFFCSRYVFGEWVRTRFPMHMRKFDEEMKKNGTSYLLTLRLVPVFPFFIVNVLAGATRVPFRTFLWTTAVGIVPATGIYAYAGKQLGVIDSFYDVISWEVILALTLLGSFVLIPAIVSKVRRKIGQQRNQGE